MRRPARPRASLLDDGKRLNHFAPRDIVNEEIVKFHDVPRNDKSREFSSAINWRDPARRAALIFSIRGDDSWRKKRRRTCGIRLRPAELGYRGNSGAGGDTDTSNSLVYVARSCARRLYGRRTDDEPRSREGAFRRHGRPRNIPLLILVGTRDNSLEATTSELGEKRVPPAPRLPSRAGDRSVSRLLFIAAPKKRNAGRRFAFARVTKEARKTSGRK